MSKFGLLVGNGFTRDFSDSVGLNSSKPLECFSNPNISYDEFIEKLPSVKEELINSPITDDFVAINTYNKKYHKDINKHCQLRRFLAQSYSLFQLELEKHQDKLLYWKWTEWLFENSNDISFAISLNYDLLLEQTLSLCRVDYHRVSSSDRSQGIPIFKPHGSIDFDIPPYVIRMEPPETRWFNPTDLNQGGGQIWTIDKSVWLQPRVQADIIPPLQENYLLNAGLEWIANANKNYHQMMRNIDDLRYLIIIGHSFTKPDRPEVKFFLNKLPKDTFVYVVGSSKPSPQLIQHLKTLQLKHERLGRNELPW